jgi:hypothetical protein
MINDEEGQNSEKKPKEGHDYIVRARHDSKGDLVGKKVHNF